ncbi:MAG: right-handed parallel beta-helix repeat-containing protein [Candidatus Heimdallarchaeaceae archaeon]
MKRNALLVISVICLILSSFNLQIEGRNASVKQEQIKELVILALTPHASFVIDSDADFITYSLPGTGIVSDPYIIEGYNITTTDAIGISISDTTKYFVIRNCYVDAVDYGIALSYVDSNTATIVNNTCNNNYRGGIDIYYSGGSTIINNTCNNDFWGGINLYSSSNSILTNNTCNNNLDGIMLRYSSGCTITNNTFSNDGYGLYLIFSGSSTVVNNTFTNCGLRIYIDTIDAFLSYTIENNWVNGKKLGFYTNLDSTIISEPNYGQLILVNCTNVTVRDQTINSASIGLFLHSCIYSVIINNTFSDNSDSIILHFSINSTIANNTCSTWNSGVELHSSGNSIITNNTCNNGGHGVYINLSANSTVTNNTCNNNYRDGIFLLNSGSSTIADNTFSNNDEVAIELLSNFTLLVIL